MGTVLQLYAEPCYDEQGRVVLEIEQRWINRKTQEVCVIDDIEFTAVDDEKEIYIYLRDLDGIEYDGYYTEGYFRRHFRELYNFQKSKNQAVLKKPNVRNLRRWKTTGLVVSQVKR